MNDRTISETYFEELCANEGVACERIPETTSKTADYRVRLDSTSLIVELKQLDPSPKDKQLEKMLGTPQSPGAVAPSNRVQGLISDGYAQIKNSSDGKCPAMIVVYNNSGDWNWIDAFTVAKAMFGAYGIVLGFKPGQERFEEIGRGYLEKRKVTRNSLRFLSAVGVLARNGDSGEIQLVCYHNPFATIPIDPGVLAKLANEQHAHPNPHERGFVPWEFTRIDT